MQWQPIETAPKDGTSVDLWRGLNGMRLTNAHWSGNRWVWKHYRYHQTDDQITHWMPLPPPPTEDQ